MEEDESVHSLKGIVLKGIGSSDEGFSVEELTEIAVGLVFDQLAQLFDSTVPRELLESIAHDLLPQSLDAELTSRMDELEKKIDRELGRIQRDLEGPRASLGKNCNGCSPRLWARIDLFSSSLGRRADCAMCVMLR